MTDRAVFTLRIRPALKARLVRLADKREISVNALITQLLTTAIVREEQQSERNNSERALG